MLSLLLAVPSCIYSFWHGVIPTSYFILMIFILVSLISYPGLALTVACGEMMYPYVYVRTRMHTRARSKTEVVTFTCNQDKMALV